MTSRSPRWMTMAAFGVAVVLLVLGFGAFTGRTSGSSGAALTADPGLIAYGGFGLGGTHVITRDGIPVARIQTASIREQLEWSPDGKYSALASGGDVLLYTWDGVWKGRVTSGFYPSGCQAFDFSPDSQYVAIASFPVGHLRDGISIYDVATFTEQAQVWQGFADCVDWSPDGTRILVSAIGSWGDWGIKTASLDGSDITILSQ